MCSCSMLHFNVLMMIVSRATNEDDEGVHFQIPNHREGGRGNPFV